MLHYQLILVVTVYILLKITQQPTNTSGNLFLFDMATTLVKMYGH